jgi:hypothetical protein
VAAVTRSAPVRASPSTRPNQAVVSLEAVRFNTRALLPSVGPAAVLAAVKADATVTRLRAGRTVAPCSLVKLVGGTGIEPVTSSVPGCHVTYLSGGRCVLSWA